MCNQPGRAAVIGFVIWLLVVLCAYMSHLTQEAIIALVIADYAYWNQFMHVRRHLIYYQSESDAFDGVLYYPPVPEL